ncbi:hypothetical protein N825_36055, partial [Skermanella stibiiresistens SB22]
PDRRGALGRTLRRHAAARLPEHMVPGAFVFLDKLPLGPTGKLDTRGLPEPGEDGPAATAASGEPPRTSLEAALAEIWAEVLGTARIGIHANFFEVGGHSLLATRVVSRVRARFGVDLPLRLLFERPTVADFAAALAERLGSDADATATPVANAIPPADRSAALPLSYAQQRLWFLDRLMPGSGVYNVALGLKLDGALDEPALRRALTALIARHETLRTRFPVEDGKPRQEILPPFDAPLAVLDAAACGAAGIVPPADMTPETLGRALRPLAARPIDLERGPPLALTLVRLAPASAVLVAVLHHAITDGWSMGVLAREVTELYRAEMAGETAALPPLAIQYADFSAWQQRGLAGSRLTGLIDHWRDRLAGAPEVLELPWDSAPKAGGDRPARSQRLRLNPAETDALRGLASRAGGTLFMALHAGFSLLLSRWSGQRDIVVGTPIANRTHDDLSGLIGCFVNTLALRLDLSGDPTGAELVERSRQVTLDAYAHQDAPFELVVDSLGLKRSLADTPLFQAMLVLQNAPGGQLELPGLTVTPLVDDADIARFDVLLTMVERDGGIDAVLECDGHRFNAETSARMARHLKRLLVELGAAPEAGAFRLPLTDTAAEAARIAGWRLAPPSVPEVSAAPGSLWTPIDRAATGTSAEVLNPDLAPVPIGLPGTLWIADGLGAPPTRTAITARWTETGVLERRIDAAAPLHAVPAAPAPSGPSSPTEEALLTLWSTVLERPVTDTGASFFELGGHSFLAVQLMARVESLFGCRLPLASLFTGGTIAQQAALIDRRSAASGSDEVLVMLRASGDRGTILLPHEISGHVLCYQALSAHLAAGWTVAGLQARGLDNTRPPLDRLADMAACYADAVTAAGLPGPFVPVGYSFGASLAAELAAELERRGLPVATICVIDALADPKAFIAGVVPSDDAGRLLYMVRAVEHSVGIDLGLDAGTLRQFGHETRIDLVHQRLTASGAFGGAITRDQVAGMLAVFRANLTAADGFAPSVGGAPLHVWVTDALAARPGLPTDLGWSAVTTGPVTIHRIAGDHASIVKAPLVEELARDLNHILPEAPS